MPRPSRIDYEMLLRMPPEMQLEAARQFEKSDPDKFLKFLLEVVHNRDAALASAQDTIRDLGKVNAKLTSAPWQTAIFTGLTECRGENRALAFLQGSSRALAMHPDVEASTIATGSELLVSAQGCVLGVAAQPSPGAGTTATFERMHGSYLVLRHRDEELIVRASAWLDAAGLQPGDRLLFHPDARMAFERVAAAKDHPAFIAEAPSVSAASIGGLDAEFRRLRAAIMGALHSPEFNQLYGLCGRRSILLTGPPGCGKTLIVKAVASEFTRSGRPTRVAVVKPASWESPYVGETQANIRNFFTAVRAEAENGPIVVFFDEVEAIGRQRGGLSAHHSDKFLAALLPELDGFEDRGDVIIVAATNRKDLLDNALLQRLSGTEIAVGRPKLEAARAIFSIHLPETVLFSPNGSEAPATRAQLVESAISRLFAPNADNQVARLKFRDARERIVVARELICGRIIEQICTNAKCLARDRHAEGGEPGICGADLDAAFDETLEQLRTMLSPENVHQHLTDLPHDAHVAAVEPLRPKVNRRHYLS